MSADQGRTRHASELENTEIEIRRLKTELAKYEIIEILQYCYITIMSIDWDSPQNTVLTSPYRQCTYIAKFRTCHAKDGPNPGTPKECMGTYMRALRKDIRILFTYVFHTGVDS